MDSKKLNYILIIPILFAIGAALVWNIVMVSYLMTSPDNIKLERISRIRYGAVKITGKILKTQYGQVDFSSAEISDGSGSVTVLFGLYSRIEDPEKKSRRDNLNVKNMPRERAIRELNKPVHYDEIEVIGVYYPVIKSVYAYYLNGRSSVMEFFIIMANFAMAVLNIYAAAISIIRLFR